MPQLHKHFNVSTNCKMIANELKHITAEFEDIKPLIDKRDDLLKQTNRVRRQLKTKLSQYEFLKQLVDIGASDTTLDKALKAYFNSLGFSRVDCVGKRFKEEDVRLWTENKLIIFETTGSKNIAPTDDKVFQIFKHVPVRQSQNPNLKVFGVFVFNHDNLKPFDRRTRNPFDKRAETFALAHGFTVTTTIDLFNAYLDIQKSLLKPEELIEHLCSPGVFKILGHRQSPTNKPAAAR